MVATANWTRENLAWAAGLFDGEGCISFGAKKRTFSLQLSMTDEDVVKRFANIVGIGKVHGPYVDKRKSTYKALYVWSCSGFHRCQAIIAALWEWFGVRRKNKAEEVLAYWRARPIHGSDAIQCKHGHPFSKENTYLYKGVRACKTCRNTRSRDLKRIQREMVKK